MGVKWISNTQNEGVSTHSRAPIILYIVPPRQRDLDVIISELESAEDQEGPTQPEADQEMSLEDMHQKMADLQEQINQLQNNLRNTEDDVQKATIKVGAWLGWFLGCGL